MIGTGWRGHMFPGALLLSAWFSSVPTPAGHPSRIGICKGDWYEWQHCSGYHYADNVVVGFSHTHLQGTGGIDLGDVLLMPIVEGRNWSWDCGQD